MTSRPKSGSVFRAARRKPRPRSRAARSCRRTREARTNRMDAKANYNAPPVVERYRGRALVVGVVGLLVGALLAYVLGASAGFGGLVHVFRSYLVGFVFCTGVAVGSLAWLALGHMTGGAWALTSRRLFEAASRTIPLCALFFIPVIVSTFVHEDWRSLYDRFDPAVVPIEHSVQS